MRNAPTIASPAPLRAASALALGAVLTLAQVMPLAAQDAMAQTDRTGEVPQEQSGQPLNADGAASDPSVRPMSFADLAEEVSPAVVNITTTTMVAGRSGPSGAFPEGSPFEEFFRDFNDREDQPRRSSALGSGFVVSADGYVVTNNHVIEGADEIEVEFYTGGSLPAEVIGTDPESDIALLKVDGTDLPFVQFGDSDGSGASVGDWVMAMGNPLGQGFSISAGIISARGRALQGAYDDYIQTDAAINRGNSGGPLFNMEGEVIGVNTAILSPNGGSIGIGFAMSSSVVSSVVDQLQEFGETRRGWLGVHIQAITPDMVGAIAGLDAARGALITAVPEGPAQEAGIEAGDVILSFDGQEVEDDRDLVRLVGGAPIGEAVEVTVLRNGDTRTLPVTLGRRETVEELMPASAQGEGEAENADILGLSLSEITPSTAEEFGLDEGTEGLVVTQIDPASDAAEKGLAPGDIITEAGQQPVTSLSDLQDRVSEARDAGRRSLLMLVRRGGEPRFVALVLGDDDN